MKIMDIRFGRIVMGAAGIVGWMIACVLLWSAAMARPVGKRCFSKKAWHPPVKEEYAMATP